MLQGEDMEIDRSTHNTEEHYDTALLTYDNPVQLIMPDFNLTSNLYKSILLNILSYIS